MPSKSKTPFFTRTDWLSFWTTASTMLAGYLATLAPNLTLGDSGILSTASFYGGIGNPPGYPLWSVYSWLFTVLLPFSNIAWRVAVSSAVAGALACGLIALMVSRTGANTPLGELKPENQKASRAVCGWVAGLGFGFNGAFWGTCVEVNDGPLGILLFCWLLCSLMRWFHRPERRRYFYGACLLYGLGLSQCQSMLVAAPGLLCLILIGDKSVGRDLLLIASVLFLWTLPLHEFLNWTASGSFPAYTTTRLLVYVLLGVITTLSCHYLALRKHRIFAEWKTVLIGTGLLILGLGMYLYLPIASMTNPPVNWGYPRTVEGFFHVLSRGQYERMNPADDWRNIGRALLGYLKTTGNEFGWLYSACALVGFCCLRRWHPRKWLVGLVPVYLCVTVLMAILLHANLDRQSEEMVKEYFNYSYVILALWAGQGLIVMGAAAVRPDDKEAPLPATLPPP